MSQTRAILRSASELRRAGGPFLLATVVRVEGSSYRRPGARVLLSEERWEAGSVSGGCLERDLMRKGWWRTQAGSPALVTYDSTGEDETGWAFGLGCGGVVELLLERLGAGGGLDPLRFIERCGEAQERGVLATVFRSEEPSTPVGAHLCLGASGAIDADPIDPQLRERMVEACRVVLARGESVVRTCAGSGGSAEVLFEAVEPPPRLFVCGTGQDAVPLVKGASALGWEVFACESQARWATRTRFDQADGIVVGAGELALKVNQSWRALAVVMSHDYAQDRAYLAALLPTRARYLGLLGPRRRSERLWSEVTGRACLDDPRLHAPVGLDLGAETPHEIALSVLAEMQAVLAHAAGGKLSDRSGPIHGRSEEP